MRFGRRAVCCRLVVAGWYRIRGVRRLRDTRLLAVALLGSSVMLAGALSDVASATLTPQLKWANDNGSSALAAGSSASVVPGGSLTLRARGANDTFLIRATGSDSGTFTIDGGRPVRFSNIRSLTIDGNGGHDVCRIVNPRGGLFAPRGGIACNGGNRAGRPRRGWLEVIGGKATSSSYTPTRPGAGTLRHRLGRHLQVIRFSGLAPTIDTVSASNLTITASSTTNDTIELVNGPANELTVQSSGGDFESVTFANKTNVTIDANTASGDDALLNTSQSATGLSSLTVNATQIVSVSQIVLPGVDLTLDAGGAISQSGPITAGTLTTSSSGGTTLTNTSNAIDSVNATNTTSGGVSLTNSHALTVTGISQTGSGATAIASGGNLTLTGAVAAGSGSITLTSSGSITQTSGVTAGALTTSSSGGTTLTDVSNALTSFNATNTTSGGVSLFDSVALTVTGISQTGSGATAITAPAGITVVGAVSGPNVDLTGDQMILSGGSVTASGAVTLAPSTGGWPISLGSVQANTLSLLSGDIDAVTAGQLIIGSAGAGAINVSAAIAPTHCSSLTLESPGGFAASGSGSLAVPTLALSNNGATVRTWTISAGTLTDGSGAAIPYSLVTSLSVTGGSGGDIFDVTASPTTTYTLHGGSSANGTLNYHAQGRTVSGSLSPPSGVINSPTVAPVNFSDMAAVHVLGASSPTSGGGSASAPSPSPTPTPALDTQAPSAPAGLSGRFVAGSLVLSWQPSTDNVGVDHYELYLNGTPLERIAGSRTRTSIRTFEPTGKSTYTVRAFDAAGNQSTVPAPVIVQRVRRPKGPPSRIPQWAWNLLAWQEHGRRGARPKTPATLPHWYPSWKVWRQHPFQLAD
jgi:hypothetical protein